MSTSAPPKSPVPSSPMRQQLDELDALLQRMLTLPVNHVAERQDKVPHEAPLAPLPAKVPSRLAAPAEKPSRPPKTVVEEKARPPLASDRPAPVSPSEMLTGLRGPITIFPTTSTAGTPSVAEPPPVRQVQSVTSSPNIDLPVVVPKPEPADTVEPKRAEEMRSLRAAEAIPAIEPLLPRKPSAFLERHEARLRVQRRAAPWRLPLEWTNRLFDRCAVALGRPGLWLVRSEGREVLGWLGVGLLVAAAVILVGDWFGWTW